MVRYVGGFVWRLAGRSIDCPALFLSTPQDLFDLSPSFVLVRYVGGFVWRLAGRSIDSLALDLSNPQDLFDLCPDRKSVV